MSDKPCPRFSERELQQARTRLEIIPKQIEINKESIRKTYALFESDPGRLAQIRYSGIYGDHLRLALLYYAAGCPTADLRCDLIKATQAAIEVFRFRGTEAPIPWMEITFDPTKPPTDPAATIEVRDRHPPGSIDYSLTNSQTNIEAVCVALSAGEFDAAGRIALLAWDPPGAKYIHQRSEVCRPYDQTLAYAVKHVFADEGEAALVLLAKMQATPQDIRPREMGDMIKALVTQHSGLFLDSLDNLLAWHAAADPNRDRYHFPHYKFLCLWGTGLSAWAIRRGLIGLDDLPVGNVYLPQELIKLAVE